MIHYVPRPTLVAAEVDRRKIIVAACGEVRPAEVAYTPRLVTCPSCRRQMVGEEREA